MAAFIIAIRGTVAQAVLLGLSAAISRAAVVWAVALGGPYFGRNLDTEATEPYLQLASAVIVAGIAAWMIWRTRHDQRLERAGHGHGHARKDHRHGDAARRIDTGHGAMALEVCKDGVPPRWRVRSEAGRGWAASDVTVVTERPDGTRQAFAFTDRGGCLESVDVVPEPHESMARVSLGHGGHTHDYDVPFIEHGGHDHLHEEAHGSRVVQGGDHMDARERAHADDIARRFRSRSVTTGQIVIFGLTGGVTFRSRLQQIATVRFNASASDMRCWRFAWAGIDSAGDGNCCRQAGHRWSGLLPTRPLQPMLHLNFRYYAAPAITAL